MCSRWPTLKSCLFFILCSLLASNMPGFCLWLDLWQSLHSEHLT